MGGMLLGVYQEPGVEFEANHSRYLSPGKRSHSPCPYDAKEIGNAAIDGYQLHLLLRNGLLRKSRSTSRPILGQSATLSSFPSSPLSSTSALLRYLSGPLSDSVDERS
jgi:hypothetical protein